MSWSQGGISNIRQRRKGRELEFARFCSLLEVQIKVCSISGGCKLEFVPRAVFRGEIKV